MRWPPISSGYLSRSFKYHRPRGALTMAGQDANTMIQLPSDPNALADRIPLSEGLEVMGQNYSGSLNRDRGALLGLFSRFLPVGFYYKAFFKTSGHVGKVGTADSQKSRTRRN